MRARPTAALAGEEGFSVVELLVAMSIFGIVMMAMTRVVISGSRSIGDQRLRTAATRVATNHLETLRSLPFEQLPSQAGSTIVTTPDGRTFPLVTEVTSIDAATGQPTDGGDVRQITVTVQWMSGGTSRTISYTTAIGLEDPAAPATPPAITAISLFPSPAASDASGNPLEDVRATVALEGFAPSTLVHLSWTNADGTAGAKTLTSSNGLNWDGTIAKAQLGAALAANGLGEVEFTVTAGNLVTVHTLAVQRAAVSPPTITIATVTPSPLVVKKPAKNKICASNNQCENTSAVTFAATVVGLDPLQDSVIVQYQLHDGTFEEAPLNIAGTEWRLTRGSGTTKFQAGTARNFRFSAIRSSDNATATATVLRDVLSL